MTAGPGSGIDSTRSRVPAVGVGAISLHGGESLLVAISQAAERRSLVTLTGPVGVGKTRLALEWAQRCGNSALILDARDETSAARLEVALSQAGAVVLDQADDLADAMWARLDRYAGPATVLVTSRAPLDAAVEHVIDVAPLALAPRIDPTDDGHEVASAALFSEFAAGVSGWPAAMSDRGAMVEICRVSAGLPLAIESLASWLNTLSVSEVADRAAELLVASVGSPGRAGRGWLATVERALDAEPAESRAGFDRLGVLTDEFDLADAAAVLDLTEAAALPVLRDLIRRRWVVASTESEPTRYRMLAPIRAVAAARLAAGAEGEEIRIRYARHLIAIANESEQQLLGPKRQPWADRMSRLDADLNSTLDWAEQTHCALAVELSVPLWQWWLVSGQLVAGLNRLTRLLVDPVGVSADVVAHGHCGLAILLTESGEYAAALPEAAKALERSTAAGDDEGAARAATVLGSANRYLGRQSEARKWFEVALERRQVVGSDRGLAVALNNVALAALDTRDLVTAQEMFEASLRAKRRVGDPRSIAIGLVNLADLMVRAGQRTQARDLLHEASEIGGALGDQQLVATIACTRGEVAALDDDLDDAVRQYEAAIAAYQATGGSHDIVPALRGLADGLVRLGRPREAIARLRQAEAICIEVGNQELLAPVQRALSDLGHGVAPDNVLGLTARQAEILSRLAEGASNKQLASELFISVATVERHLATIYRKLGVTSRVEATRLAIGTGLVAEPGRRDRTDRSPDYARGDHLP